MNVHTAMSNPLPARTSGLPWPVWAMLGLALITLAGVGWQRLAGGPPAQVADVTWQRALHFEDRSNGDVAVLDAQDRREEARFQGEQGFLRGALGRNLAELIIRANRNDGGDDGKPELVHMWFPPFPRDCSLPRIWHFRRNFERLDSEAAPIRKAG